jgi:hypothetical protein
VLEIKWVPRYVHKAVVLNALNACRYHPEMLGVNISNLTPSVGVQHA